MLRVQHISKYYKITDISWYFMDNSCNNQAPKFEVGTGWDPVAKATQNVTALVTPGGKFNESCESCCIMLHLFQNSCVLSWMMLCDVGVLLFIVVQRLQWGYVVVDCNFLNYSAQHCTTMYDNVRPLYACSIFHHFLSIWGMSLCPAYILLGDT